mmetsp:Transcript_2366/g.6247  ORF Transcript_2366/g.6247 Transcript_2366/m.6247 type:complete len:220 (+) Transcript_2366:745-1404(+)
MDPALQWMGEEVAEKDDTLALLSEGCQSFLRGILEKAIYCSRQRQNADGIRLWHDQHVLNQNANKSKGGEAKQPNRAKPEPDMPSLSLRLGCDVQRQVARAAGTTALTCKRMEEALGRQSDIAPESRHISKATFAEAHSMSDLAMRPQLKHGVRNADVNAKRAFDRVLRGPDETCEAPFGRLPKQAKLELIDLSVGMNFSSSVGVHQATATTTSASLFF